jgi:hypothetical protein
MIKERKNMINNILQVINYKEDYIFRSGAIYSINEIEFICSFGKRIDIKKISELQLTTEVGKANMNILLNATKFSPKKIDEAFDYFIPYKDNY